MSTDHDNSPEYAQPPASSSGKKWLKGGIGCLVLLILLCGVGGYFGYTYFVVPFQEYDASIRTMITTSGTLQEKLGDPLEVGIPESKPKEDQTVEQRYPVKGPDGSGVVVVQTRMNGFTPELIEIYLEVDGERMELDPDEETPSLEIDGLPPL